MLTAYSLNVDVVKYCGVGYKEVTDCVIISSKEEYVSACFSPLRIT